MTSMIKRFVRNESGATAIEYGLIAAIIAVGLIASLQTLRGNLQTDVQRRWHGRRDRQELSSPFGTSVLDTWLLVHPDQEPFP